MKTINCTIKGVAPLLHNRFAEEEHGANKSTGKKKVYDPVKIATKKLYKDAEGNICAPSEHIYSAMVKAGVDFKFEGRKTYMDIIKAGITVEPELIPMNKESWDEIDARPVVIQRARVMGWRPRFNEWELSFKILILDDENIPVSTLKEILDRAGQRKGVGDYRPRFGRFQVIEWKEDGTD